MLYLKAPDPERYLPWKIRPSPPFDLHGAELLGFEIRSFEDGSLQVSPPITIAMSRKHDRTQKINEAAFEVLKASVRLKPWWIPVLLWRPIYWLAAKIVFR